MSTCCSCILRLLFALLLWLVKKLAGIDVKKLFFTNTKTAYHIKCRRCKLLLENVLFNSDTWNTELRNSNVPVRVNYGSIDSFEIDFGWLLTGNIHIKLKGVNMLLNTTRELHYNHELEVKRLTQYKRFLVRTLEKLHGRHEVLEALETHEYGRGAKIALSLIMPLVRKLKIDIEGVHLRIEDNCVVSQEMTSFGLVAECVELDENKASCSSVTTDKYFSTKQLKVNLLSSYWNPNDHGMITGLPNDTAKQERLKISNYQKLLGHCYVLLPCSPSLCVTISPGSDTLLKVDVRCNLDSTAVNVSKNQLRAASILFGNIKHLQNLTPFLKHKPHCVIHGNTKEWWIYAFKCICLARKRSSKWNWLEVKEESDKKVQYAEYYGKFLTKKSKKTLRKKLKMLEDELSVIGTLVTRRKVEKDLGITYSKIRPRKMAVSTADLYSLCGECDANCIELSLLTDDHTPNTNPNHHDDEDKEIFTIKVFTVHLAFMKDKQESRITASVTDAVCLGVEETNNDHRANILFCDSTTSDAGNNALSLKLSWLNESEPSNTKPSHYNYDISIHVKPSVIYFGWSTFKKLVQFGAVIRGTHRDLQDAVKAQVKAVGRESRRKFRHFIANKEQASVDADINLPVIVFDTPNTQYRQLCCHFGRLNVKTSDADSQSIESSSVHYKVLLVGTNLSLCTGEMSIPNPDQGRCSRVFVLKTIVSEMFYTTFNSSIIPSNLSSNIQCSELYLGLLDGTTETLIQFCYDQFDKLIDTMKAVNSTEKIHKSESFISSSPSTLQPQVISNNAQSEILQQIVEEEDFSSQIDYEIFKCEVTIDLLKLILKDADHVPNVHVSLNVHELYVLCFLKEQATELTAEVSLIQFKDHTHTDESTQPIDIMSTQQGFLSLTACLADHDGLLFTSQYQSIEERYNIELKPFAISLHYEFLYNTMTWVAGLSLPPFWLSMNRWYEGNDKNKSKSAEHTVAVTSPPCIPNVPNAVNRSCTVKLHDLSLTLDTSSSSSLLTANVQDIKLEYCDQYDKGTIDFSIQFFSVSDGLIVYDSPYHQVISSKRGEKLTDVKISYSVSQSLTSVDVVLGSLKIIYLHKLIRSLQMMFENLLKRFTMTRDLCSAKLCTFTRLKPDSANDQDLDQSVSNSASYIFNLSIFFKKCSFKLPRESYHPDALTLKAKEITLNYKGSLFNGSMEIEEPSSSIPSAQPNTAKFLASAASIELNWNYGSMKSIIATTNTFFIDKESSCYILGFDIIKVYLTGEVLASVPGLIARNFSEKNLFTSSIIPDSLCEPDFNVHSNNTSTPNKSNQSRSRKQPIVADEERFDPFLKIVITQWNWMIQNTGGISTIMAVVNLTNSSIMIGTAVSVRNGRTEKGMAVKLFVDSVSGVEGVATDTRQKVLTKHVAIDGQTSGALEISVYSFTDRKIEVSIGFCNLCLCVWPAFLHILMKFKKQMKLKEGKRGKWWNKRRRSTTATLAKKFFTLSKSRLHKTFSDSNIDNSGFVIKVGLESCYLAVLENPSSFEVTTPGVVLQFQSSEDGSLNGFRQLEYNYSSPLQWHIDISSCWFHGNLCLFGENIIPLTKVLPPTCLSLNYTESNSHDKLTVSVPVIECHVTNELYQVISNFYNTYRKQNLLQSTDLTPSVVSDDIWSIRDFNRTSVLPDYEEEIDGDGLLEDISSDEDEMFLEQSVRSRSGLQQPLEDSTDDGPQQEAYIDLKEVTINFDLMSSGDSDSIPVMCLHSNIHSVVHNWSTQLGATADLTLESFIYNERRGLWEPLLEPINSSISDGYKPYTLHIKVFQVFDMLPGESILQPHKYQSTSSLTSLSVDQRDNSSICSESPKSLRSFIGGTIPSKGPSLTVHPSLGGASGSPPLRSSPSLLRKSTNSLRTISKNKLPVDVVDGKDNVSMKSIEDEEENSTYVLLVTSDDRLEMTMTPSALKTLKMYTVMLEADYQQAMGNIRNCVQDSRPPVRIENKTGITIRVYPGPTFKEGDSNYEKAFTFRVSTLKHFPSRVENITESTDGGSRTQLSQKFSGLMSISEESLTSLSSSSPSLSPRSVPRSRSHVSTSESEQGLPFHIKSYDTCRVNDVESYCEDIHVDDEDDCLTSLSSLQGSFIPIIEGNMNEDNFEEEGGINRDEGEEDVDGAIPLMNAAGHRRKLSTGKTHQRKSVCHLQLMGPRINEAHNVPNIVTTDTATDNNSSTTTPSTGADTANTNTTTTTTDRTNNYWKPKILNKTHKIKLQCYGANKSLSVPVALPGVFAVPIIHEEYGHVAFICDVSFKRGVRKVTIRSGLQIQNSLPFQVVVYSYNESTTEIDRLGEIGRNDTPFNIPFFVTANRYMTLKFGAGTEGIPCRQLIHWKTLTSADSHSLVVACPQNSYNNKMYYFQASIKRVPAIHLTVHSPSHMITLEPAFIICNHLPVPIDMVLEPPDRTGYCRTTLTSIDKCDSEVVLELPPSGNYTLRFTFKYNGLLWAGEATVGIRKPFKRTVKFTAFDKTNNKNEAKMYVNFQVLEDSLHVLDIFSLYWIVNKTNIDLEFEHQPGKSRIQNICHKNDDVPLLLTYKPGKFNEQQHKLKLRVIDGEWSKPFVLGAVGKIINAASLNKEKDYRYEFAIETHLLKTTLSEIVYIMPKYSIMNYTHATLLCSSVASNGDTLKGSAVELQPNEHNLEPFWPGKHTVVNLSIVDEEPSPHSQKYQFSLSILTPTVIKTNYTHLPVITVKVQPDPIKGTTIISIRPEVNVGTMLKIQNLCRCNCIKFMQKVTSGSGQMYPLEPNQSILYTWDCPVGSREINWQVDGALESSWRSIKFSQPKQSGKTGVLMLKQDGSKEGLTITWTSMFEGSQLVLRFLDNEEDYKRLMKLRARVSPDKLQFFCSLDGLGISLVDNTPKEIAYLTIMSSPIIWTRKRSSKAAVWSVMDKDQSEILEAALQLQQPEITINKELYNLEDMTIDSGKGGEICRTFNPGVWVWHSQCDNRQYFNLKLGRFQIDNQMADNELYTKVIFSEIDSRSTGNTETAGVPFLDLEISITIHGRNEIREYEKVLLKVKPSQLNIELSLISALLPFADTSFANTSEKQKTDMERLDLPLAHLLNADTLLAVRTLNYVDILQINHTSVYVTYTTAGEYDLSSEWGKVLNAIIHFALITKGSFTIGLKSVHVNNEITDFAQLKRILYGHYRNEVFWQFQHFALGLDVIGNPAKLFNSFQIGAKELVFKSREGIMEGETGHGIALGVKGLLGHVVGGGANAVVSSTGTLSSMLLAATDLDYQRKHRHMRQEKDSKSQLLLAGKFFLKHMFHGTTDIFVKPATGAMHEGVEGFLKGLGRGTVSILVKPTLGVVDLTKYTMESVRSAVDDDTEVHIVRRPRLLHVDKEIHPYSRHEAEGLYILNHLSRQLPDEVYIGHCWQQLNRDHKITAMVIMITSKRLLQLHKDDKKYSIDWSINVENIHKVQATEYCDEDSPEENKPGLLLKGIFNKSSKKAQNRVLSMETRNNAKIMKEKLQIAIKSKSTTSLELQ